VQSPWGDRVTPGFVSGRGRAFRGPRGRRIKGGIEHTAPLARGSSGSPLVDATGRVVGISTHRLGDGFYLALPADAELRERVDALAKGDDVRGKRLGISVVPGPAAARLRAKVGLPEQPGLLVAGVAPGSPADAAGVSEGDLVVAVDGHETPTVDALWDVLDDAGDEVVVRLVRGTDEREVTLSFTAADGGDDDENGAGPADG
jgi:serine protease Do